MVAQRLKRLPGNQETRVRSLGREDPLEKEIAPHSSTLAWRIPWREVVPGTSVFTSSETDISGNFWGLTKLAKYCFKLQDETWDFS